MMFLVKCRVVVGSGEVLFTQSEVDEDTWTHEREAVIGLLRAGIVWQAGTRNETPVGDIKFAVMRAGFPPEEIERGTL